MEGKRREFDFVPSSAETLGGDLGLLRIHNVNLGTGDRSYYFINDLACLEQALCAFALDRLQQKGFQLISVPELIDPRVIEGCGFKTSGERTQVYRIDAEKKSPKQSYGLIGTAEMPLAGFCLGREFHHLDLPLRLCAVSNCYRAETSDLKEEKGIYRVHQFTKVEMFCITAADTGRESDELLEELVSIEKSLFSDLGLHFRVLDMPTQELGASAHRKFDIEAWVPSREFWGEISSASNCTDFQSIRLSIKYRSASGNFKHAHTVNGTACAVPRMIMAILENYQNKDGSVNIPATLQPYIGGKTQLKKSYHHTSLNWIKKTKLSTKGKK